MHLDRLNLLDTHTKKMNWKLNWEQTNHYPNQNMVEYGKEEAEKAKVKKKLP